MSSPPLPIGIEDFKSIIENGYYYIDKTMLIKELLNFRGTVNLFTRPRRFGKTLNMSMLQYFFEQAYDLDGNSLDNSHLFDKLSISSFKELFEKEQGRYPVISISLKSLRQPDASLAFDVLKDTMAVEFQRHSFIINRLKFQSDQDRYMRHISGTASAAENVTALQFLSRCLAQVLGRKVIILIDEYDVPLENAYFKGFYDEMADYIRSFFESALKSNQNLEFAVITGCLRISKESIFTGLNNLKIVSLTSRLYAEHFGFTGKEIKQLIKDYHLEAREDEMKSWYDGYCFGGQEVYNPWSIVNYVENIRCDAAAYPRPYWSNTSSNDIIRTLIEKSDAKTKQEIEVLMKGESIRKPVYEDITYEDMKKSGNSLWNFLFFTGYLRQNREELHGRDAYVELAIPNEEVMYIYRTKIIEWFQDYTASKDLATLYDAVLSGNAEVFKKELTSLLQSSISYYDSKEAFYHGFLAGLFQGMDSYILNSNRESGTGRYDLQLWSPNPENPALIFELKAAEHFQDLDIKAIEAIEQIRAKEYTANLRKEGYSNFICYGIAFYKKSCSIKCEML